MATIRLSICQTRGKRKHWDFIYYFLLFFYLLAADVKNLLTTRKNQVVILLTSAIFIQHLIVGSARWETAAGASKL